MAAIAPAGRRRRSLLERLLADPRRFGFDAAVRLLLAAAADADPAASLRFRSVASLAQPPADLASVARDGPTGRYTVVTSVMGLAGATGVLPRGYSEVVSLATRGGSRSLHAFLDMLSHRFVAHFANAGIKYRPSALAQLRDGDASGVPDPIAAVLLALAGYGLRDMAERLQAGPEPLCHYAGFFAMRPRSADRLAALLSDWCGRPVEVVQFAGTWLPVPPDQQTRLRQGVFAGRFDRLGHDATIGTRAWTAQARVVLRIGSLRLAEFEALLPGRPTLRRLVSLTRSFLGHETGFAVNPVLSAGDVPRLRLASATEAAAGPLLGWNTWLPAARPHRTDGEEALFEAELIEALQ